jgi:hypothetical protein
VGSTEEAATAPQVSKPAAQTIFVLDTMEELKAAMLARFDAMDMKIGALEQV